MKIKTLKYLFKIYIEFWILTQNISSFTIICKIQNIDKDKCIKNIYVI